MGPAPGKIQAVMLAALLLSSAAFGAAQADDRPIGLIEQLTGAPEAEVGEFDYLYDRDKVDLRPSGSMTVSYFGNCSVDTFAGGVARFKDGEGRSTKGGTLASETRDCQSSEVAMTEDMVEAGAAIKRLTPFGEADWLEWTVKTTPIFKWEMPRRAKGPTQIRVEYADAATPQVIWQTEVSGTHVAYPESAPALEDGKPYRVVANFDRGDDVEGVFSVDPALEVDLSTQNRLVPLGWE